jgi:hypothetical protein
MSMDVTENFFIFYFFFFSAKEGGMENEEIRQKTVEGENASLSWALR